MPRRADGAADAQLIWIGRHRAAPGHLYHRAPPRRPGYEDEIRRGQTRTSYSGDDFLSIRPSRRRARCGAGHATGHPRALRTNRDLPIPDDRPTLTLETGDPVQQVRLLAPMRRPRPSLRASLPSGRDGRGADGRPGHGAGIAQLSLNHVAGGGRPRRRAALVCFTADRGDPTLARHYEALVHIQAR